MIAARAKFERRRYDAKQIWKPSSSDKVALAELINKRAGRRLL
jgi:hypothetical protein